MIMPIQIARVAKNAPGAFFVRANECLVCQLCVDEAPDLMVCDKEQGDWSCYFTKQPETSEEVERALHALECCCIAAVAYEGDDPAILARIAALQAEEERRQQTRILASNNHEIEGLIWKRFV